MSQKVKYTVANLKHVKALILFHSVCQMLAKYSGVESERTVSKFRKRKLLSCVHVIYQAGTRN